jgi:hypothetical protein
MNMVKALGKVLHNGVSYRAGDVIKDISVDEAKRLVNLNVAEQTEGNDFDEEKALTPEEFGALKADEQKDELRALEIDPEANAADRLKQYVAWYDSLEG